MCELNDRPRPWTKSKLYTSMARNDNTPLGHFILDADGDRVFRGLLSTEFATFIIDAVNNVSVAEHHDRLNAAKDAVITALDETTYFGTCIGKNDCRFNEQCQTEDGNCEHYKLKQARDKLRELQDEHPPCVGCGEPSVGTIGLAPTCQRCYDNYHAGHRKMTKLMEDVHDV